jgi:ornithine decarboxylase
MISKSKLIISKKKIQENYSKLQQISDVVCYSVKTNPYITEYLEKETDSLFLTHHIKEIEYIKDTKRIWFMLHGPDTEEMSIIFNKNINNIIVDNLSDLDFLLKEIEKKNYDINLLLRMRLKEYTVQTGRFFVYGMYPQQINETIQKLKNNKNITQIGIHFHRKTQNIGEWSLIKELNDLLTEETWKNIDLLNIGGGIPVVYKNISQITIDNIYKKIKELKKFVNANNIKLMIEPGRSISATAGKLITNIKTIVENNIFVDASVFNYLDLIENVVKFKIEGEKETGKPYVIKGLTPASEDIFRYRVYLEKPKVNEKIVFLNAGAYIFKTDLFGLGGIHIEFIEDFE